MTYTHGPPHWRVRAGFLEKRTFKTWVLEGQRHWPETSTGRKLPWASMGMS